MTIPLLRTKMDSIVSNFSLCNMRIEAKVTLRKDEAVQRTVLEDLSNDATREDCSSSVVSENNVQWLVDRMKNELEVWTIFAREMGTIVAMFQRYKDIIADNLNRAENEDIQVDLQEWLTQVDGLLALAGRLHDLVVHAQCRINKEFTYKQFVAHMIMQDKLFDHFTEKYKLLLQCCFLFIDNVKHSLDDVYANR